MLVGSIDIGITNVGFAVFDTDRRSVVHLERFDLRSDGGVPATTAAAAARRVPFSDKAAVWLVQRAIAQRAHWFERCNVVAVEKQPVFVLHGIFLLQRAALSPWRV